MKITPCIDKDELLELLKELEWSDHHYDPAHDHSHACPICAGCSSEGDLRSVHHRFGHSDNCTLAKAIRELSK